MSDEERVAHPADRWWRRAAIGCSVVAIMAVVLLVAGAVAGGALLLPFGFMTSRSLPAISSPPNVVSVAVGGPTGGGVGSGSTGYLITGRLVTAQKQLISGSYALVTVRAYDGPTGNNLILSATASDVTGGDRVLVVNGAFTATLPADTPGPGPNGQNVYWELSFDGQRQTSPRQVVALAWTMNIPAAITAPLPKSLVRLDGSLVDRNGQGVTGSFEMIFRLYASATGGKPLWTETRAIPNTVSVDHGQYEVFLGTITPLPASLLNRHLWLGVAISDPSSEVGSRTAVTPPATIQVATTLPQ